MALYPTHKIPPPAPNDVPHHISRQLEHPTKEHLHDVYGSIDVHYNGDTDRV